MLLLVMLWEIPGSPMDGKILSHLILARARDIELSSD